MSLFVGYNTHDYRGRARKVLPSGLFQFIDRGTEDETGLQRNRDALAALQLQRRVFRDVSRRSTATTLFGKSLTMPVAVAPTGAAGLAWYNGELALARAASAAGIPFTLATGSLTSMEKVAAEAKGQLWFQLYVWPDRSISHAQIERVLAAGYEALVVTADLPVPANREYNLHTGFTIPFRFSPGNILDVLCHPRWIAGVLGRYMATTGLPRYENYPSEIKQRITKAPLGRTMPRTDSLTWSDLAEIRRLWPKTLIVKGLLYPGDAALAIEHGADAVIVSNHGGRAFDPAMPSIAALPGVVAEVRGRVPVLIDSGFMRGSDVVKAIALGADCVLIGRATLYGVAAAGEAGAGRVLSIFKEEIDRTLAMLGVSSLNELTAEHVVYPGVAPSPLPDSLAGERPRPVAVQ